MGFLREGDRCLLKGAIFYRNARSLTAVGQTHLVLGRRYAF